MCIFSHVILGNILIIYHLEEMVSQYTSTKILFPSQYCIDMRKRFYPNLTNIRTLIKFAIICRNSYRKIFNLSINKRVIPPIVFDYFTNYEETIHKK